MYLNRNDIYRCSKIIFNTVLVASIMIVPMNIHAQATYEAELSILDKGMNKVLEKIQEPLRKLRKKKNLTLDDIAQGAVKIKKNIDMVANINMDCGKLFDKTISKLKNEYGVNLPKNKLKRFKKLIQHYEKAQESVWFEGYSAEWEAMSMKVDKQKEEDDCFNVSIALAILEGFCGAGIVILGGYIHTYPGGSKWGGATVAFGTTLMSDAARKFFDADTYEPEKNEKYGLIHFFPQNFGQAREPQMAQPATKE